MEIPKHFTDELRKRLEKERKAEEEKDRLRKDSEERIQKLRDEQNSKLEIKLGMSERIFGWKDEFLKTEEGLLLLSKYQQIKVYGDGWGHSLETDHSVSCWSYVRVSGDAISYTSGYKWMPSSTNTYNQPRQMALHLNHEYLDQLLKSLDNGKVFGYILKHNK